VAAHSRFGGSSASRWLACPGSVALCESIPAKASSSYADEGSAAHALAAACLANDEHPTLYLGAPMEGYPNHPVTQEMCDAVVVYLNAVSHEIAQTPSAMFYVEKGFVLPISTADDGEVFGTNDALVFHPATGRLRVFDYKHGQGVSVSADDNAQLKFYAAGAVFSNPDWKVKEVVLTIVQPRARDNDTDADAIRDWTFDTIELLEFVAEVEEGVQQAKYWDDILKHHIDESVGDTEGKWADLALKTGSHCRWCDAAAVCPAREAEIMQAAQLDFTDMTKITVDDLPIVTELDTARLGQILKAGALLNDWLATVQEYVEGLLMGGTPVEGWKVVEKIGRAKWVAAEEDVAGYAEMMFGLEVDQIRPRKLTTITDAEKLLKAAGAKKDQIDDFKLKFTLKESSGLTMAPTSDRRPAVDAIASDFKSVNV
jgi:uncharacterized protein DUF2800